MTNNLERDDSAGYSDAITDLAFFAMTITCTGALCWLVYLLFFKVPSW